MKKYTANITTYYNDTKAITKDITFTAEEGWRHIERIAEKAEEQFGVQIVCNSLEEV